jgi:DNA polymerase-3 subunit delta
MSHPILERHLERRGLKPLYLFFGEEQFLMQRALRRLEQALTRQAGEAPLKVVAEAQEVELGEFLAQARNAPLWGTGQLLVLRQVETYPAEALKALSDYLARPAPRTVVVLIAEGFKSKDVARQPWSRLQREEAALGFYRLKEGELNQWLTREARNLGKTLSLDAAQRLVEIAGANLFDLTQELEKLALLAGEAKTLTSALVSQSASHSRTYNIFALVETLGEAAPQKRLAALGHLLDLGEPPARILTMLARQIRLLLRFKENPEISPEAARRVNLQQWQMEKLARQAALFSPGALRAHLFLLHQTDYHLKTSTGPPRVWLEWCLLQMGPG